MNIEANSPSASPAPAQKAGTGPARSRTAGDGPAAGSFLSMLSALTNPAGEPGLPRVDAGMPSGQSRDAGADDAGEEDAALQQAAAGPENGVSVINPAPAVTAAVRPDAVIAPATGTDAEPADGMAIEDGDAAAALANQQDQQGLPSAADEAAGAGATRRAGAAAANGGAMTRQWMGEAAMDAGAIAGDAQATASASDPADGLALRPLVTPQSVAGAASVVSMFEAGLAGLRTGPGGRAHERAGPRVDNLPDSANGIGFAPWADGGPASSAPQAANPVYAPTATAQLPGAALAQKLHFWVAGGVQSAELQLDAFGGGSVDVRIAVKGDEAYVEFRSDQPQARRMLLDTMPQLERLLAGEGLMLSGGFVGGSAPNQSDGGSARRDRFAGTGPALDRIVEAPATAAATPMRAAVGSAIDLFV